MYKCKIEKRFGYGRDLRILLNSTSNDETRPLMQDIFRDKHCLVATCGRTLFVTSCQELLINTNQLESKIIGGLNALASYESFDQLASHNLTIQGNYPIWTRALCDVIDYKYVVEFNVPKWFKNIKQSRYTQDDNYMGINKNGVISIGRTDKNELAAINMHFLAQYAGETIYMHLKDANTGILITGEHGTESVKDIVKPNNWFGVIMPIRI